MKFDKEFEIFQYFRSGNLATLSSGGSLEIFPSFFVHLLQPEERGLKKMSEQESPLANDFLGVSVLFFIVAAPYSCMH